MTKNLRILITAPLVLFALYSVVSRIPILGWKYRIPVEIVIALSSAASGLLFTPIAALLLRKCAYKNYMLFYGGLLLVLLAAAWLRFKLVLSANPFLPLSFTIPGAGTHFLALRMLSHKNEGTAEQQKPHP